MTRALFFASVLAALLLLSVAPPAQADASAAAGYVNVNGVLVDERWSDVASQASPGERLYAVVGYDQPPTPADVANLESSGLTVVAYRHLPYAAVGGTREAIESAVGSPGVRSLHANREIYAFGHSADPDPSIMFRDTNAYGTGVTSVLADRAWAIGDAGAGVTVAVIDTGIDTTNPSLLLSPLGPVLQNVQVLSDELLLYPQHDVEVYLENQVTTDTFGHGTHVSGSVAGSGFASSGFYLGVAPRAHLVGLDGLQCNIVGLVDLGVGCLVTILSSFDWILENHEAYNIRVETNSWGSGARPFDPNDPISRAVDAVLAEGITVLFAAGNSGPGANTMTMESRHPGVIAVAASQPSGGLVEFSSRGLAGGDLPTIAAPGHLIISSRIHSGGDMDVFTAVGFDGILPPEFLPNYLVAQGTSMATPVAAGVAALVLSADPTLSPGEVKALLQATATPMLGHSAFEVGAGHVNAEAAVLNALGKVAKATRVKLPAQMSIEKDANGGFVTLSHDYRASIAGTGLVGFGHFAFSFPVYTNEARPFDIVLRWETVQRYAVYTTGYRMTVFDPTLTPVTTMDTDIATLEHGLTIPIDAATRADRTPAGGAHWYMDMVNFNPGWGILDFTPKVQYSGDFKPPFKTETLKPAKVHAHPDRSSTHPGGGLQAQGSVQDRTGAGVDGVDVRVELSNGLGVTVWSGTATTVGGHFSTYVSVPSTALDGTYALRATAAGLSATAPLSIDSTPPVLTGVSISPVDGGSFRIEASATDAGGIGAARAWLTSPDGSESAVFLREAGGVYAATVARGTADLDAWRIELSAIDRAGNAATVGA